MAAAATSTPESLDGSGHVHHHSVLVTESTSLPHQHKDIRIGVLGRGYNILNGSVRGILFDDVNARFTHNDERRNQKTYYFKDYEEAEREMAKRVGIEEFEQGMFSMIIEGRNTPFLCPIERVDGTHYLCTESVEEVYQLDLDMQVNTPKFIKENEYAFANTTPFNSVSKANYYNFIEKYGTHFIKRVNFGAKAEFWWSYEDQLMDVFDRVTKDKKYRKKFNESFDGWKECDYGEDPKNKPPSGVLETKSKTSNFNIKKEDKSTEAELIGFRLEELSSLFPEPQVRTEFEIAIKVYLEEMKPIRDVSTMNDNAVIGLFNPETKHWVRVDPSGHLYVSNNPKMAADCRFEAKKKGIRIGLKSVLYGSKLISRGLTKPTFNFHRFQFIGPHESFQLCGDYIQICGNITAPTFLYATETNEISHEGTGRKKTRLMVLSIENRAVFGEGAEQSLQEEPIYEEDVVVDVLDQHRHVENKAIEKLKESGGKHSGPSPIYKANSTSSLFIKETIHLPNIDELTRRMAAKILNMIRDVSDFEDKSKPDIFNEEQYPLTNQKTQTFHKLSLETIFHFLNTIFKVEKLAAETSVMSLIYLQRVLRKNHSNLTLYNWRRLCLSTLILAAKVFEDLAVWNVDFVELFPGVSVHDLNRLEKALLQHLEFNVSFSRQEYVGEYFDLYQYATHHDGNFEGKPLDEEALKALEVRSAASEKIHMTKVNKSISINVPPSAAAKKKEDKNIGILS